MNRIALRNFLITALTTLICIAVFIALLLGQMYIYTVDSQFKTLEHNALGISYMALTWITESYRLDTTALGEVLTSQAAINDTCIMIADVDGAVLISASAEGARTDRGTLPAEIVEKLSGKTAVHEVGTLGGWYVNELVSVILPVEDAAGNVRAAVIVSAPPENLPELFRSFTRTISYITLLVLMLSFALFYFFAQRMAEPLRSMSAAAKKIARGDFSARVRVRGSDEIADLAQSFNYMAESMERLEQVRSEFVANVSHELKTPMTTIAGFVDGILDGTIPPDRREHYLAIVSDETHRLSRMVTRLLLATRMQSGARDLNVTAVDICSVISSVLVGMEQTIEEKELSVEVNFPEDRVFVMGDNDALTQVVSNLVDNAVKYNVQGGHLAVTVGRRPEKVNVTVFNTGAGIREQDIPYIFDRFYKADRSRGLDKQSTGLGLYLVKSILRNLKQDITTESSCGEWVRFTFTLAPAEAEPRRTGAEA